VAGCAACERYCALRGSSAVRSSRHHSERLVGSVGHHPRTLHASHTIAGEEVVRADLPPLITAEEVKQLEVSACVLCARSGGVCGVW
jgi:hypothetical protein